MEKNCSHCAQPFIIRQEDQKFLEDVSPLIAGKKFLIPLPKLCPRCREQRRLAYRNERVLYRRKSDLSGKEMISFFHPDAPFKIYTKEEWWSDEWDAMDYGVEFDFSRPFFEQFYELTLRVPRVPLVNNKSENAEYCNFTDNNKNCYLIFSADDNEDCYYCALMAKNRAVIDSVWIFDSELLYECVECTHCYNLRYCQNCENCSDSAFLLNCRGVRNSLFCVNLRNKEYHMFNKPVGKERYVQAMKELAGSYSKYQAAFQRVNTLKQEFPLRKADNNTNCENVTGDNVVNSKNVYLSFDVYDSEDCAYSMEGLRAANCYDIGYFDKTQWCYEGNSLIGYGLRFTNFCKDSTDLIYCDNCHGSKNCFGCIGLKKKEYCIFNRQYSKEEYKEIVPRIIEHMKSTNQWGEFFPMKYSLFPYNETVAQEFYPLKEEEAAVQKLPWRQPKASEFLPQKIQLPDNISEADDSICNEILSCEVTGKNFRIIPQELKFYRMMKLPLPRKCPDQRHLERLARRNPRKLWKRQCQKCSTATETTYAPDRPEIIYCEKCYLAEVY